VYQVSGDFEIHFTVMPGLEERLAAFAAARGVKFVHIQLDRGSFPSQPMLTISSSGSFTDQRAVVETWLADLRAAGMQAFRFKIEAAPWCTGVPHSVKDARSEPDGRYFEHHIKLRLVDASMTELARLTDLVAPHGARLSSNARRQLVDGTHERFLTQRCHGVGLDTARERLDALVAAVRSGGYEVAEVEQEYVVLDSRESYDHGWLEPTHRDPVRSAFENGKRTARAGAKGFPPTYLPLAPDPAVRQRASFDPALKQYVHAYRAGEPEFADPDSGARWRAARHTVMTRILAAIAGSTWVEHLVLRGSITMAPGSALRRASPATWISSSPRTPSPATARKPLPCCPGSRRPSPARQGRDSSRTAFGRRRSGPTSAPTVAG
jgi:hypothetical protein